MKRKHSESDDDTEEGSIAQLSSVSRLPIQKTPVNDIHLLLMDTVLDFLPRVLCDMTLSYLHLSDPILHCITNHDRSVSRNMFCNECARTCRIDPVSDQEVFLRHHSFSGEGSSGMSFFQLQSKNPLLYNIDVYAMRERAYQEKWYHVDEMGICRTWMSNHELNTISNPMNQDPKMFGLLRAWSKDILYKATLLESHRICIQRIEGPPWNQELCLFWHITDLPGSASSVWRMAVDGDQEGTVVVCLLFRDGLVQWCSVTQKGNTLWSSCQVPELSCSKTLEGQDDHVALLGVSLRCQYISIWTQDSPRKQQAHLWHIPFLYSYIEDKSLVFI